MARAPINAAALTWAREVSNTTIEDLAKSAGVKPLRILEFESGDAYPTFRQLAQMADKLDRSLGFFFATPPTTSDVPATADFRGRSLGKLPANLVKEMRRAEQHRDAMLDLEGRPERRLESDPIDWKNLEEQAGKLRLNLGLSGSFVPPGSPSSGAFKFWRTILEDNGFLVFQTTRIPLDTFRGLSIHHADLPIIMINGADSAAGRIFTLFHEVAHLINRTSGLCALREEVNEEALANNFSANVLMPEPAVQENWTFLHSPITASEHLAQHFKVSTLAAAVRLRRLDVIDEEDLEMIRKGSDETWKQAREANKRKEGFVPTWRLRYRDLGANYIGTVARAIEDRRVDLVDATYLLNARLPMVEDLLGEYYRTSGVE